MLRRPRQSGSKGGVTIVGTAYDSLILDADCDNGGVISQRVLEILSGGGGGGTPHGTSGSIQCSYDSSTTDIVYSDPAIKLTLKDLQGMRIAGGPVIEEHWERKGKVGTINESWLEGNKLKIRARVEDPGVAEKIRDGTYAGLSIGYRWTTDGVNKVLSKSFREVSVCQTPVFKGCVFSAQWSSNGGVSQLEPLLTGLDIKVVEDDNEDDHDHPSGSTETPHRRKSSIKKMMGDIFIRRDGLKRSQSSLSPPVTSTISMADPSQQQVPPAAQQQQQGQPLVQPPAFAGNVHKGLPNDPGAVQQQDGSGKPPKPRRNVKFADGEENAAEKQQQQQQQQEKGTNDVESDDDSVDNEIKDFVSKSKSKHAQEEEQRKKDKEELAYFRKKEQREIQEYAKAQHGRKKEFQETYKKLVVGEKEVTEEEQALISNMFTVPEAEPFARNISEMARMLKEKEERLRIQEEELKKALDAKQRAKRKVQTAREGYKYMKGNDGEKRKVASQQQQQQQGDDDYARDDDEDDYYDSGANPATTGAMGKKLAQKVFNTKGKSRTDASWETGNDSDNEQQQQRKRKQQQQQQQQPKRNGNTSTGRQQSSPRIENMFGTKGRLPREGVVNASALSGGTYDRDVLAQVDDDLYSLLSQHSRADPMGDAYKYLRKIPDPSDMNRGY